MKINRRDLISLIIGFMFAITKFVAIGLAQKKTTTTTRKQNLPFFIGWYESIENINAPVQVSSKGIDIIMPIMETTIFGRKPPTSKETIKVFLDTAKKAKIKVLMEISHLLVDSGDITGIKDFIRTYKNHPSVYGWYLYDEPELKKPDPLSPDLLTNVYQAIKQEDKSKPVGIVFSDIKKAESYSNALDILMWDCYPCNDGVAEFQWLSYYRSVFNQAASMAEVNHKKFWNVLQAYGGHGVSKRLPTKAEFRYMFYYSILSGTDGLLFWMRPWSTPSWNESILYPTIQEFRDYIPAIIKGGKSKNIAPVNYANNVEIKLFPIPNSRKIVAVAINHERTPINLIVKVDRKLAGKAITCDNKKVDRVSMRSDFKIALNPYEVRLYKIG